MTKTQRDLLRACWNRRVAPNYDSVREYAYNFKKYDNLSIREINEVSDKLSELYKEN